MWKKPSTTKEPENAEKAYEYAVFLLSLQLRTAGEILDKMARRGYSSVITEAVLEQLHGQSYLDDERYATVFLDNLKRYKNLGYYGIKKKFLMKKLQPDLISKILDEGLSPDEELKIAERFLKKEGVEVKSSADNNQSDVTYSTYDEAQGKQKQKIMVKLKSRGFRGEVISRLLR
ncbi:MAG: RecX family transcriptional regulator [Candidatus Doudnabacteria bacterium]|nr:RecX family transcriptional regulator [Candidatus Doudnabacteria bacterium]